MMRVLTWLFLILFILPLSGAVARKLDNHAFGVGEKLRFALRYGPIRAGTGVMQVKGIEIVDGRPTYHVVSTTRTNEIFSLFFKVRDRIESFIDVEGIFPRRFEKYIREGKYRSRTTVFYDQENGLALTSDDTTRVPPYVQDFISSLYFIRTQNLKVGESIFLDIFQGDKIYPLEVKILRRERVKVDAGTFDCLVVELVTKGTGLFFKKGGTLVVWLTDDERKMPVLMKSKVKIGSISAELVRYSLGSFDHQKTTGNTKGQGSS